VSIQAPLPVQLARPKAYFYFYSPLQTIFSSPTVSDTTSVNTLSTTRTTAKTYTLSIPTGANTIRVIIYGYVNGATGYFILNIDGVDVQTATTTSTSEVIVMDYVGSISPGTRTIRIDYYISQTGFTVVITKVFIATGIGLTSTTLSDVITFSVTYQLLRFRDIRYSPGVRVFVWGNRKTTAPTTLVIGSSPRVGRNQLGAGNDNATAETFLAIITGSVTLQEGGEFTLNVTLQGAVRATGDVIIITRVLARAQLRREVGEVGEVRVYERGVAEYAGRLLIVPVPGGASSTCHAIHRRDVLDRRLAAHCISGTGSDVTVFNIRVAVVAPIHFDAGFNEDHLGEGFLEWVQLVVWG
jgi:hypothetical protein